MKKHITLIGFTAVMILMASCNLEGPGIFRTISQSVPIDDASLATQPVRKILGLDSNVMYLLHHGAVRKADISVDAPDWNIVQFGKGVIGDAAYDPNADRIVFSALDQVDGNTRTLYVADPADPANPTAVPGIAQTMISAVFYDSTDDAVYAAGFAAGNLKLWEIDVNASTALLVRDISNVGTLPPSHTHFIDSGAGAANKHVIAVFSDTVTEWKNYHVNLADAQAADAELLDDNVFRLDGSVTKPYAKILGTHHYGTTSYLINSQGVLLHTDDWNGYTAVNQASSADYMDLFRNAAGKTQAVESVPLITVKKSGAADHLLLIGGYSRLFAFNVVAESIPTQVSVSDELYAANISPRGIMDFFDIGNEDDFQFHAATHTGWVWKVTSESASSEQLL